MFAIASTQSVVEPGRYAVRMEELEEPGKGSVQGWSTEVDQKATKTTGASMTMRTRRQST